MKVGSHSLLIGFDSHARLEPHLIKCDLTGGNGKQIEIEVRLHCAQSNEHYTLTINFTDFAVFGQYLFTMKKKHLLFEIYEYMTGEY